MKRLFIHNWKRTAALLLVLMLLSAPGASAFAEGGALDDGSPWVDYVLRENVQAVAERPESPKDDLYLYVNYDWAKEAEIRPGYRSSFGLSGLSATACTFSRST